ncbi:esterase/lipase family protein [Streptacidiphilus sp. PAMC 29251]
MRTTLRRSAVVTTMALAAAFAVSPGIASASTPNYPVNWSTLGAVASGVTFNVAPPGANQWNCRPSAAHPDPVVLVHGFVANQNIAWQAIAPSLANQGYCVYSLTYGQTWYTGNLGGIDDLNTSEKQLASFVSKVLASTGAAKVDLVAHSEGGNLSRLYIKDGGASKVDDYVALAPVNMGPPSLSGLVTLAGEIPGALPLIGVVAPAIGQLTSQSWFTALNSPSATVPGITYTDIASTHDEAVTPYTLAFLPAAANVTNITLQSLCPDDGVGHLGLPYDSTALALVENSLDPAHPQPVPCTSGFPL